VCIIRSPSGAVDASPMATVMDASGRMFPIATALSTAASAGIVTVVTSPGVPSILVPNEDLDDSAILSVESDRDVLICRGCTLASSIDVSESEQQHQYNGLAASSAVSDAMVVEGITMGDIEGGGLRTTRHARTLTALFQSRANMATIDRKQVLILAVSGAPSDMDDSGVVQDVRALFQSATMGVAGAAAKGFDDMYDLRIMPASSSVRTVMSERGHVDAGISYKY
jgi:hypothetical protein